MTTQLSFNQTQGNVISVKDYGATGDGVTDDYAACQAAIDVHSSNGDYGTIYFPRGIYILSDTLTVSGIGTNPNRVLLLGAGPGVTYLYHTGAQTSGAIKLSGDTVDTGGTSYPRNAGSTGVRDMAIGSAGGSCIWTNFVSGVYLQDIGFLAAETSSCYLRVSGSHMGFYERCVDYKGNQAIAGDAATLIDAAATRLEPTNGYVLESGTDASISNQDGIILEHWFHNCRLDTGNDLGHACLIQKTSGADNFSHIYFSQCKFTAPTHVSNDYQSLYIDGAVDVHWMGGTLEHQKSGNTTVRLENQLGPSELFLTDCDEEASGEISLGTNGGVTGGNDMRLHMDHTNFRQLLIHYSDDVSTISLYDTKWIEQPSAGVDVSKIERCHVVDSWVLSSGTYYPLDISRKIYGNKGGNYDQYTCAVASSAGGSTSIRKSRGTQIAPANCSDNDTIIDNSWQAYAGGAYKTVLTSTIIVEDATTNYTARLTLKDNDSTEILHLLTDGGAGTGRLDLSVDLQLKTKTPASAGATGRTGTIAWDASYIYICVATDTWERAAIATW